MLLPSEAVVESSWYPWELRSVSGGRDVSWATAPGPVMGPDVLVGASVSGGLACWFLGCEASVEEWIGEQRLLWPQR